MAGDAAQEVVVAIKLVPVLEYFDFSTMRLKIAEIVFDITSETPKKLFRFIIRGPFEGIFDLEGVREKQLSA